MGEKYPENSEYPESGKKQDFSGNAFLGAGSNNMCLLGTNIMNTNSSEKRSVYDFDKMSTLLQKFFQSYSQEQGVGLRQDT